MIDCAAVGRPRILHERLIHPDGYLGMTIPEAGTGPFPINRVVHQTAPYRVGVNILDHCGDGFFFEDVVVKTSAGLPESKDFPRGVLLRQTTKPCRLGGVLKMRLGTLGHRPLQGSEDSAHLIVVSFRVQENVHVLGHDDIRPMGYMKALPHVLHGRNDPFSGSIPRQQWEALKTGERKEVRVSGFIPCYASLSRERLHAEQYTLPTRSGVFND